jgi:SH3-like domain-containing protein
VALRFRKSLRIAPGVRLNFTQRGISTTVGPRGASVNMGSRGTRANVGLPGTGLSYSQQLSSGDSGGAPPNSTQAAGNGCALLGVIGFVVLLVGMCSSPKTNTPTSAGVSEAPLSETAYVSAKSANCRSAPSKDSSVVAGWQQGDATTVVERSDAWAKVQSGTKSCWISSALLSSSPVAKIQSLASAKSAAPKAAKNRAAGAYSRSSSSSTKRRSSTRYDYSGGTCPCSGSNVCIGPRGGRYCITSGGNKRYGV